MSSRRGTLAVWPIAPHVYATFASGQMAREMSDLLLEHAARMYVEGIPRVHGIHDWLEMTSYEPRCRSDLTAWVMRKRANSVVHIGVSLPLVAMGVTVANLALGDLIQVHRDRPSLQRALDAALAAR